jgi:hypothetical protein
MRRRRRAEGEGVQREISKCDTSDGAATTIGIHTSVAVSDGVDA